MSQHTVKMRKQSVDVKRSKMRLNRASEVSSIVDLNAQRQLLDARLLGPKSVRGDKADVSRLFLERNNGHKASSPDASPRKNYDRPWEQETGKPEGTVMAYAGNLPAIRKRKGASVCSVSHRFNLDIVRGDAQKYDSIRNKP